MADVALLSASVALTICLPRHASRLKFSLRNYSSMSIALGLSLSLFSLSILEVLPSSWRVLLDKEESLDEAIVLHGGFLTVTTVYRIILWGLCVMVIGVLPAVVGSHLMEESTSRQSRADPDDAAQKKYPRCTTWKSNKSGWYRCLWRTSGVLIRMINVLVLMPCCLLWRRVKRKNTDPILVMTVKEDETRKPSSPLHNAFLYLLKGERCRKTHIIGCFCGVATCFVLLSTLGPQVIDSPREDGNTHPLATLVSWLCSVGLLVSSILNGFGSVSMPHSCLVGLYLEPIRPDIVAKAEDDLAQTAALLETKTSDLESMASSSTDLNGSRRRLGPLTRKSFAEFGEDYSKRRKQLQKELDFLEMLYEELEEDVADMKRAQLLATEARTQAGRIRSWVGIIFSIILLIRLFAATCSILQSFSPMAPEARPGTASQDDPITTCLLWLMGHYLVSQEDYVLLSQCISLFLTAILSVSQVRTFLRTVAAINRRINQFFTKCDCKRTRFREAVVLVDDDKALPFGARPGIYTHLLAILMGCYFLSCLVLTKLSLPVAYRSNFAAALGGIEYRIHSLVVNGTFAVSAIVSAAALGVLFGIQRQSTRSLAATWMNDYSSTAGSVDSC